MHSLALKSIRFQIEESLVSSRMKILRWRIDKAHRRLMRGVLRRLYVDRCTSVSSNILIAGSARSGTTWLGDTIADAIRGRIVFGPFHRDEVTEARTFPSFPYLSKGDSRDALKHFFDRLLAGEIRGPWVDRQVERLIAYRRVIKAVRANLFLSWFTARYTSVPVVRVIRHPCAVVPSRMEAGWSPKPDLDAILAQPQLIDRHLGKQLTLIQTARSDEELKAIIWCVHNLAPRREVPAASIHGLFYEHLCERPEHELQRALKRIGPDETCQPTHGVRRPSATARPASTSVTGGNLLSRWKMELSRAQVGRILGILDAFGLGDLYGDDVRPLSARPILDRQTSGLGKSFVVERSAGAANARP